MPQTSTLSPKVTLNRTCKWSIGSKADDVNVVKHYEMLACNHNDEKTKVQP